MADKIPLWRKVIYLLIAPCIIVGFMILHPRKVLEQAKKEWRHDRPR